jgi:hypothetical protein
MKYQGSDSFPVRSLLMVVLPHAVVRRCKTLALYADIVYAHFFFESIVFEITQAHFFLLSFLVVLYTVQFQKRALPHGHIIF